ncbi:hypothetical protein BH11MYX3_BH11MYX3_29230 [soil metagenome]
MWTRLVCVVALAGCGRIGFDARGDGGGVGDVVPDRDADRDGAVQQPPGLVAWFPLDDPSGTVARDATGNGNDATCTSCPTMAVSRTGGIAKHFDGTTQHYLRIAPTNLDFTSSYTVAAWVRPARDPAAYDMIMGRAFGGGTDDSYGLDVASGLRAELYTTASLYGTTSLTVGTWWHVAATFDGTTTRVYVNGTLEGSAVAPPPSYDGQPLVLAGDTTAGSLNNPFGGDLADLELFSRALSAGELSALAQ